jgi:hypothetical protein
LIEAVEFRKKSNSHFWGDGKADAATAQRRVTYSVSVRIAISQLGLQHRQRAIPG